MASGQSKDVFHDVGFSIVLFLEFVRYNLSFYYEPWSRIDERLLYIFYKITSLHGGNFGIDGNGHHREVVIMVLMVFFVVCVWFCTWRHLYHRRTIKYSFDLRLSVYAYRCVCVLFSVICVVWSIRLCDVLFVF